MTDRVRLKEYGSEERYKFDPIAHAVTVIQEQHRLLHDGFMFQTSGKQTGWLDTTSEEFLIRCPAACFPHVQTMLLNFGKGDIDFLAFEGPTVTDPGTALTAQNPNRASSNTPDLLLYATPTTSADGTQIFTLWTPPTATGVGQSANGVRGIGQGSEWVLAPSTDYLVRLTNNSGATIDWSYEFAWYEVGYLHNKTVDEGAP